MNIKRIIYFVLTIAMAIIIFLFSSQTSQDSNNLSYQIDIKIYEWIKSIETAKVEKTVKSTESKAEIIPKSTESKNQNVVNTPKSNVTKSNTSKYPLKDKLFKNIDYIVRKTAHVTLYALFALFLALFIKSFGIKSWKTVLIVLTIGFLYACLDEYNQKLGGTRTGKFKDSLIDTGGCLIGVVIWILLLKIKGFFMRKMEKS